ncbi:MAG: 4Fe-4S dicluster domain-containing protein [Elusimicrobiales bacterium]
MLVNPELIEDIKKFGAFDVSACFNCGNCTAVCPLTKEDSSFPRKTIRFAQIGAQAGIASSPDPWLCYYCGDCSATCPREAYPGEFMMSVRRYLTALYDWTGVSRRMYLSKYWELGMIAAVAAFVGLVILMFHGPLVTERVELNTFAPVWTVHFFDLGMAAVLSFFLLTNAFRMYWLIMHPGVKLTPAAVFHAFSANEMGQAGGGVTVRLADFLRQIKTFVWHTATQIKLRECEDKGRWVKHFLLVSGYVIMFILIVGLLPWFQTDNIYPIYHPQRWLGYYATAVLTIFTLDIIWGRIKKDTQIHKFSDFSDWMFPVLLFLTTITGILVHIFRYMGLPLSTYYTYVVHLMVVVPMLVVEVPFSKWAHLFYRPFAIFLYETKRTALARAAAAGAK